MFSVKRNKIYIFFIFAVSFLVWSYAPETYKRRISTIFETRIDESGKTDTRADTWIPALKAGLENPITGLGAGTSLYVMGRIFKDWHSVHNSFVQAISEIGIIGGFFYISLFIIPFRHYRNYIKRNALLTTEDLLRMQAIMLSFISYIATGFFLPQAYFPVLYMLTGFFVIQGELIRKRTVNLMLKTSSSRSSDRIMQKNIKDNSNYFFNRGS